MATKPPVSVEELRNAREDAVTWERLVNDDEPAMVPTRLGGDKPNYAMLVDGLSAALWVDTVADLPRPPDDPSRPAMVGKDTDTNNGLWRWNADIEDWERAPESAQPANSAAISSMRAELLARPTAGRVPLSSWGEAEQDILIDPSGAAAGGADVQNNHEQRITALEGGGVGGETIRMVLGQGQSNGVGNGGMPMDPETVDPLYPESILMPAGPTMNVAVGTYSSGGYGPIEPSNYQDFQGLKSLQISTGNGTTYMEAMGFSTGLRQAQTSSQGRMLFLTTAQGGMSLANRSPGTIPYANTLVAIERSVAIAQGKGAKISVDYITSVEGEADTGNTTYAQDLIDVYAETLTTDIKTRTGQKHSPPILLAQPSSFYSSLNGVLGIYEVCRDHPRFYLVAPGYPLPYNSDQLHFTARGHSYMGGYFAKAAASIEATGDWKPLMPKFIRWDGSTGIDVWFHVPKPPLVHDLDAIDFRGNWGFDVRSGGSERAIASIEIVAPDQIHIETVEPLDGTRRLRYAMKGYGSPRVAGEGPAGALRDSDDTPSFTDGTPLHNWCVHFIEEF